MLIIQPEIQVENYDGIKIMKNIERACRTCYRSEGLITEDSYKKLLKNCINRGHESVLEHEKITIRMICDIGCYDEQTQVLTENGWKYFYEVEPWDKVYTLDDDGKVILSSIQMIIKKEYNGPMYNFHSTQVDLSVTPDHNMWVFDAMKRSSKTKTWKFLKAEEMTTSAYKFDKRGNKEKNISYKNFIIPAYTQPNNITYPSINFNNELLYELLGWWITDGGKDSYTIELYQTKEKGRTRIEYLLKELRINYSVYKNRYRLACPQLAHFIIDNFYKNTSDKKSYDAFIPSFIKNSATNEIEAFLRGVIGGDGTEYNDGRKIIYSSSEQFAKDLIELYFKIGKTANYYPCPNMKKYSKSFQQTTICYCISVCRTEIHWFDKKEKNFSIDNYNGIVYCLMLKKYHRLFVMRNGKACWCGNCYKDLTRHRFGNFSIESTRYCNYGKDKFDNEIKFIEPVFYTPGTIEEYNDPIKKNDCLKTQYWERCMKFIESDYMDMTNIVGAKPDELRMLLPHSTAAEVTMTANIREWRHILGLRCSKAAHPAIRQLLIPLLLKFKEDMPELFSAIDYDIDFPKEKYAKLSVMSD